MWKMGRFGLGGGHIGFIVLFLKKTSVLKMIIIESATAMVGGEVGAPLVYS